MTDSPGKRWFCLCLCLFLSVALIFTFPVTSDAFVVQGDEAEDEDESLDLEESIEFTSPSNTRDLITFDIFKDIARARSLLEPMESGFTVIAKTSGGDLVRVGKSKGQAKYAKGKRNGKARYAVVQRRKSVRNELGEFTILLAVEDITTREIKVVRVHPRLGGTSEGVVVEPGKSNGVNTTFTIVRPEHHVVLALKRPVRQGATFREVIYTPYSENLDIPEVRRAGLEYLKQTVREAKADLMKRNVAPLSCDRFVNDDVAVTMAIIEHIDPGRFESGKYPMEKLIHETLVIIGTNRGDAYGYSKSKAGAQGLFQFIPDTYRRIARLYGRAGLHDDFGAGMKDHINAAKASLLLFDADTRALTAGSNGYILGEPDVWGRFLASAYNCGAGRTRGAMARAGERWHWAVPAETQIYLKKYDAVRNWLRTQS